MLGMPMTAMAPQPAPSPEANVGKKTILGMAGPVPEPAPPQAPRAPMHRTMLGIAPPSDHPPSPASHPPQAAPAQPPAAQPSAQRTMLGVALPGIAPVQPAQPGAPSPPAPQRTMLGVAMPGIAPVRPDRYAQQTAAQPQAPQPGQGWYDQAPPVVPEIQLGAPPASPRVVVSHLPFYRRTAFFIVVFGLFVAVAVGLFALFWPTAPPITAQVAVDDNGADILEVRCPKCPDGTVLSVQGAKATAVSGQANIPLTHPLVVGENRFEISIDRPGNGRDETVQVVMPVAYRIKPDLSALQQPTPLIRVDVQAKPGTTVLIDGQPVAIGSDGKGSYTVDVSAQCEGPSAEVKAIEKSLPYEVKAAGGVQGKGTITVKVGVSPLTVQSPRAQSVIADSNFLVAGRTTPNAVVEIEGTKFSAGADGMFARRVQMKAVGGSDIRVRATAPGQAPRTVVVHVKRVDDIQAEAKSFASGSSVTVASLFAQTDALKGKPVALEGEVFDLRQQGFERVILLDVGTACASSPCLVRLIDSSTTVLEKGMKVRVFGYVSGSYKTPDGKSAPELEVAFLLPAKGQAR